MLRLYFFILSTILLLSCKEDSVEPILYGSIEGKIFDSVSGLPIEGASIISIPPTSAITSGSNGYYKIDFIPVGNYSISVKKTGYTKETVGIAIRENVITNANIYLDKSSESIKAPPEATNPSPVTGALNQSISLSVSWNATAASSSDTLSYDVYLYESNSPTKVKVGSSIAKTNLLIENLKYGTTYYWYVVSKNLSESTSRSETWTFVTVPKPQNPIILSYYINGGYDIYSIGTDGKSPIQIVSLPGSELWPRFNPNKRTIAYCASDGLETNVYVQNLENNVNYKLTKLPIASYNNGGFGFCWSNDGGKVIYGNYENLYQLDINGANLGLIITAPANRHFRECDYSPVEDKIVVLTTGSKKTDNEIYLINVITKKMDLLVDNLPGIIERPSFSIDGRKIMFTRDVSGFESPEGRQLDSHIFIMDLNSKNITDMSDNKISGTNDTNPRFSPDGAYIIFNNAPNDDSKRPGVWIMDAQGHDRRLIVENAIMPDWK